MARKIAAGPAHPPQHSYAFGETACGAHGKQLAVTAAIAIFVVRGSLEVIVRRPAETQGRAVETATLAGDMKAAFKTEFDRKLFGDRQAVLQAKNGEAVCAARSIFELITTDHRSVFPKLRLDAKRRF